MRKLGKLAAKHDPRTLRLARFFAAELAPPPDASDYTKGVTQFSMMLNDQLGCCTIAGCGHGVQIWSLNKEQAEYTPPDDAILQKYELWCGYNPQDPDSDQGGVEIDVLNDWRQSAFWGHKLHAYADTDPGNVEHVKQAIHLFGGVYIGLSLPLSANDQLNASEPWSLVEGDKAEPGSWGGHAVFCPAYDASGITCITWGQLQKMDWAFWQKYTDECHALLGVDWCGTGVDLNALNDELSQVTA